MSSLLSEDFLVSPHAWYGYIVASVMTASVASLHSGTAWPLPSTRGGSAWVASICTRHVCSRPSTWPSSCVIVLVRSARQPVLFDLPPAEIAKSTPLSSTSASTIWPSSSDRKSVV